MALKVYFLGTGTSQGIPIIGSTHPVCQSKNPKDTRLRSSIWVHWDDIDIVVDCGPDFRQQMLKSKCPKVDALLFTHEHADHTAGLDDIRPFAFRAGALPVFGLTRVLNNLSKRFDYIFNDESYYLRACEYNIMLYDFGYATNIKSKKSILKILADYSELLPSFLKNEYEDDLPVPDDDIIQDFYNIIDILMVEYRTISQKYKPSSSSPSSKKIYQEIYFDYIIEKILLPYSPTDMFTKNTPKKIINSDPYYINI